MFGVLPKVHGWISTKKWVTWRPLVEWWYNTNYHNTLGMTPYQALYGTAPSYYGFDNTNSPNEEVA